MQLLKTLKMTQCQRSNANNLVLHRIMKLAAGMSLQILVAENPNYKSVSLRTVLDEVGGVHIVKVTKRVLL